jgi:hypothetical protein
MESRLELFAQLGFEMVLVSALVVTLLELMLEQAAIPAWGLLLPQELLVLASVEQKEMGKGIEF